MAVMPRELKLKTLEGGDLNVEVIPTCTVQELKAMLLEKKDCEDPIERQILKVEVLSGGFSIDDHQTLESAGLLHAESDVTVIYCRNEIEAATKEAIHEEGLLEVSMPSSLTEIPARAFQDCKQVLTVAIPKSVTAIGNSAFEGCTSLARVPLPESVTVVGDHAFLGCNCLKNIEIPESVTSIGRGAFQYCSTLKNITIPESVTAIGVGVFAGCNSLQSIAIPESVTAIEDYAFRGCRSLESITIPESVTAIGVGVFAGCSSLESIAIPESVTVIGDDAFDNCRSLKSITIPESVTAIGDRAFQYCSSLTSISIPKSVTAIGDTDIFLGCNSLKITRWDCAENSVRCLCGMRFLARITVVMVIPDSPFRNCSFYRKLLSLWRPLVPFEIAVLWKASPKYHPGVGGHCWRCIGFLKLQDADAMFDIVDGQV